MEGERAIGCLILYNNMKQMKAKDITPGTLIQYADGEVWRVTRPGYMRPHNDAAKKANISLEIAMQEDDGAILRTNLQTLRAELEETSALFDRTPSLELLIKGEELREEIDRIRQQIIDIRRQEAWKRAEQYQTV